MPAVLGERRWNHVSVLEGYEKTPWTSLMRDEQEAICRTAGVACRTPSPWSKAGVSLNVRTGLLPLNGLRHPHGGDSSGWYIWAGEELSEAADFFQPLHVTHLEEWCP